MALRITNTETQESIDKLVTVRDFGVLHEVSDAFLFLRRTGVSDQDREAGFKDVRFGPTPGVSYVFKLSTREHGFLRTLRPGFGINVSFMDWDDPSFDPATGTFIKGTSGTDIEIGAGMVAQVFDGVLQGTLGWNLNAERDRFYYGVGFSFVNVVEKIGGLIAG